MYGIQVQYSIHMYLNMTSDQHTNVFDTTKIRMYECMHVHVYMYICTVVHICTYVCTYVDYSLVIDDSLSPFFSSGHFH